MYTLINDITQDKQTQQESSVKVKGQDVPLSAKPRAKLKIPCSSQVTQRREKENSSLLVTLYLCPLAVFSIHILNPDTQGFTWKWKERN